MKLSLVKSPKKSTKSNIKPVISIVSYGSVSNKAAPSLVCWDSDDTTSLSDDSKLSETENLTIDCSQQNYDRNEMGSTHDVNIVSTLRFSTAEMDEEAPLLPDDCDHAQVFEEQVGGIEPLVKQVKDLEHMNRYTISEATALTELSEYTDFEGINEFDKASESDNVQRCRFQACGRGISFPGWRAYNRSLDSHPVPTKAITSFCGWFLGDFITQTIITKDHPFDFRRSITLSLFGLLFHGPMGHVIYGNLDRLIVGTGPKEVIAKICVDQFLWCPIFMVCYFGYLGIANGDSAATIGAKIKEDLFTAVIASWKIWPLAHAIQFRWVMTKHRIVYINCIEVCFIMFLSFLGNQ